MSQVDDLSRFLAAFNQNTSRVVVVELSEESWLVAGLVPDVDRRDARIAAAGLRTDPQLFRPVQAGDPAIIELREWSRLAEELPQERVRLGNHIRQQLWRYYPQLLDLTDDVAAEWVLPLWTMAPTPAKAARSLAGTMRLSGR